MAIEKKLIHFKKWSDFSSKKLSANEQNTQYTLGVDGALTTGAPDILYQSICWIKDVRKMWTHGTVYDCSGGANADLSNYVTQAELDELVEFVDDMNSDISNLINTKQENITDLQAIREGAAKGATSVQPSDIEDVARKDSGYVIANGILDKNDDYWHLPKNSLNDKEHTLASKSDIEEKILVIGDSSDEAKTNFIAVANGEKTADVYIGSVDVEGYIIEGCVKLAMSGPSSNRIYSFAIIGNPTSGRYINEFIKVTCRFANGAISSEVNVIDAYSKPSTGIPATDLADDVQSALTAAESYKGTVTNITINGSTKSPTNGVVDLGIIGTYSKPSTGIPKSDLASDVQTTLDNAATFVVAAFDLSAIYSGDDIVYPQKDVLMEAIREGKAVRVPLNKDYLENGYVIAQAYCEDVLYMTIADSQSLINIETSISDPMLYASDITIHTIANRAAIEKVGEHEVVVAKGVDDGVFLYTTPTSANGDEDDVLLSRDTVKTINGESIFGSGDITIEGGGSGGGSSAYPENYLGTSSTTLSIRPNRFYVWDEVPSLTLTFTEGASGVTNEYLFQFTSGAAATTLSLPDDIKWTSGETPIIEANKIYQISILKGLGSVLEFSNEATSSVFPATLMVGSNGELGVSVYNTLSEGVVLQDGYLTLIVDGENYSITEYNIDYDYSNRGFQLLYLEDGPMSLNYILESSGEVNLYIQ